MGSQGQLYTAGAGASQNQCVSGSKSVSVYMNNHNGQVLIFAVTAIATAGQNQCLGLGQSRYDYENMAAVR